MLLFPHFVRLPTLAAFASTVNRAIDSVCNAATSAQRRLAAFFLCGNSASSSANSSCSTPSPPTPPLPTATTTAIVAPTPIPARRSMPSAAVSVAANVLLTQVASAPAMTLASATAPPSVTASITASITATATVPLTVVATNGVRASIASTPSPTGVASITSPGVSMTTTTVASSASARVASEDPPAVEFRLSASEAASSFSTLSASMHARDGNRAAAASGRPMLPRGPAARVPVFPIRSRVTDTVDAIPSPGDAIGRTNDPNHSAVAEGPPPTTLLSTLASSTTVAATSGTTGTMSPGATMPPSSARRERVTRHNFTADGDDTQPNLVVFGSPRIFQSAGEYDERLLDARDRMSRMDEPVHPRRLMAMRLFESFVMRPNAVLTNTLASMSPNPLLSPQDPVDPATQFCSCGACPDGVAMTQECRFLTIFRREQRFRRRAATSPAIGGIKRWHGTSSTRPTLGRARC